jgi:hypothetical protein
MPVVVAPLYGFALGVLFARAASEELARTRGLVGSRSLLVVALFGALVWGPACGYFLAFFPDWSYAYFLNAEHRPVAFDMAAVLVVSASPAVGFASLARMAASRRGEALTRGAAAPAIVATAFVLLLLPRLKLYATHAQFHGDFGTEPLVGSPVGYALVWMAVIAVTAAAWTVRLIRRFAEAIDVH